MKGVPSFKNYPWSRQAARCGLELIGKVSEDMRVPREEKERAGDACATFPHPSQIIHPTAIGYACRVSRSVSKISETAEAVKGGGWCRSYARRLPPTADDLHPSDRILGADGKVLDLVHVDRETRTLEETTQGIVIFGQMSGRKVAIKLTPIFSESPEAGVETLMKLPDESNVEACACAYLNALSFDSVSPFLVQTYACAPYMFATPPAGGERAESFRLSRILAATAEAVVSGAGGEDRREGLGLSGILEKKVLKNRNRLFEMRAALLDRIRSAFGKLERKEPAERGSTRGATSERASLLRDIAACRVVLDSMIGYGDDVHISGVRCVVQQRLHGTMSSLYFKFMTSKLIPNRAKTRIAHAIICQQFLALAAIQKHLSMVHNDAHFDNWGYARVESGTTMNFRSDRRLYRIPTFGVVVKLFDFGRCSFEVRREDDVQLRVLSEYAAMREIRAPGFARNFQTDVLRVIYEWFSLYPETRHLISRSSKDDRHAAMLRHLISLSAKWETKHKKHERLKSQLSKGIDKLEKTIGFRLIMDDAVRSGDVTNRHLDLSHILKPRNEGGAGFLDLFEERSDEEEEWRRAYPIPSFPALSGKDGKEEGGGEGEKK